VFAFLIRFTVFNYYLGKNNNYWQVDSSTYHKIACGLLSGNGFSTSDNNNIYKQNFYRLPGYPVFLASIYKLFNINIRDTKTVLWAQVILASFIPILIFILSLILFPNYFLAAKLASLYSCVHLGLVLYSGFFMSESLFIFLFLIFLILFFRTVSCDCHPELVSGSRNIRNHNKNIFISGLFLGFAGLVRPVGHYLLFLSIILIILNNFNFKNYKLNIKNNFKKALYLILGFIIIVSPWLVRNYIYQGKSFFHTLPGGHFLNFAAARSAMLEQNCDYNKAKVYLQNKIKILAQEQKDKLNRDLNEIEYCDLQLNLAIQYFKKYPLITIKNFLIDIFRTSFSLYSSEILYLENNRNNIDYFSNKRTVFSLVKRYLVPETKNIDLKLLIYFEIILNLFIWLGVLGACVIPSLTVVAFGEDWCKDPGSLFSPFAFILLFLVIGLAGGYARMRLPAEPLLIILAFNFYSKKHANF